MFHHFQWTFHICYNSAMKVLIAPLIVHPRCDAGYHIAKQLTDLFIAHDITCAVSADSHNDFQHVSLYPVPKARKPLFNFGADNRAHEEWLYSNGFFSKQYIENDYASLCAAIDQFQPDLIISYDRPAALMAALQRQIPCWEFVVPAMYRNAYFPTRCMHGLNAVLEENNMVQQLNLQYFYDKATRRIGYGPIETAPYLSENNVTRIGSAAIPQKKETRTNRVCIFISEYDGNAITLRNMIDSAFLGAPYYVYVSIPAITAHKESNLHYLRYPDVKLINGASAIIHDGNDFYFNQALVYGVPQMIIADHSYERNFNALATTRYKFGRYIFEEDLSMAALYEGYRTLMADDMYYENTQLMRTKIEQYNDISELLNLLHIDTNKLQ